MSEFRLASASEQVAAHLRRELLRGRWVGTLPGVHYLAEHLGVNHKTVGAALRLLEQQGLLECQGKGRKRRIMRLPGNQATRSMRVGLLDNELDERQASEMLLKLRHALHRAGHRPVLPRRSLGEINMEVGKVAGLVNSMEVDAWVIFGASREVLEWFAVQSTPAFALAGRQEGVPIAGTKPTMGLAYQEVTRRFVELGHRRIVLLAREMRRHPQPGRSERAFLEELEAQGIKTGRYNLPDWEDHPAGFHRVLDSLFSVTPPTALLIDEAFLFTAASQFLASRGIRVPGDVSLACTTNDLSFKWCERSVAHIRWKVHDIAREILRWAADVSCGNHKVKQTLLPAEFVEGGTIGPPPETGPGLQTHRASAP